MLRSTHAALARARTRGAAALVAAAMALAGCSAAATPVETESTASSSPPPVADSSATSYVAMGDSYTAAPLFPVRDRTTINSCLRSRGNYPDLVAEHLGVEVVDVSCSGASTVSMFSTQKFTTTKLPPQLDALTADTDLVTLGIGANNSRYFTHMMFDCLRVAGSDPTGAPCRRRNMTPAGRDRIERHLGGIRHDVARVVRAIGQRAPGARILLIGYPQLLPRDGSTCRAKLPLATGDYPYVNELNLRLAGAVRQGGQRAGAEFVDLVTASQGHDICAAQPWVAGVRGDPRRAMGLHPYPAEQRAVAELVIDLL